jgi:hypothetical protein
LAHPSDVMGMSDVKDSYNNISSPVMLKNSLHDQSSEKKSLPRRLDFRMSHPKMIRVTPDIHPTSEGRSDNKNSDNIDDDADAESIEVDSPQQTSPNDRESGRIKQKRDQQKGASTGKKTASSQRLKLNVTKPASISNTKLPEIKPNPQAIVKPIKEEVVVVPPKNQIPTIFREINDDVSDNSSSSSFGEKKLEDLKELERKLAEELATPSNVSPEHKTEAKDEKKDGETKFPAQKPSTPAPNPFDNLENLEEDEDSSVHSEFDENKLKQLQEEMKMLEKDLESPVHNQNQPQQRQEPQPQEPPPQQPHPVADKEQPLPQQKASPPKESEKRFVTQGNEDDESSEMSANEEKIIKKDKNKERIIQDHNRSPEFSINANSPSHKGRINRQGTHDSPATRMISLNSVPAKEKADSVREKTVREVAPLKIHEEGLSEDSSLSEQSKMIARKKADATESYKRAESHVEARQQQPKPFMNNQIDGEMDANKEYSRIKLLSRKEHHRNTANEPSSKRLSTEYKDKGSKEEIGLEGSMLRKSSFAQMRGSINMNSARKHYISSEDESEKEIAERMKDKAMRNSIYSKKTPKNTIPDLHSNKDMSQRPITIHTQNSNPNSAKTPGEKGRVFKAPPVIIENPALELKETKPTPNSRNMPKLPKRKDKFSIDLKTQKPLGNRPYSDSDSSDSHKIDSKIILQNKKERKTTEP